MVRGQLYSEGEVQFCIIQFCINISLMMKNNTSYYKYGTAFFISYRGTVLNLCFPMICIFFLVLILLLILCSTLYLSLYLLIFCYSFRSSTLEYFSSWECPSFSTGIKPNCKEVFTKYSTRTGKPSCF